MRMRCKYALKNRFYLQYTEELLMSNVLNSKKTIVMGGVVLILLLMQIESFAGPDWEVITQLPTERWGLATAVVDDKIYIIGGSSAKDIRGPDGLSTVEEYDPKTNTWRQVADMPTPRYYPKVAVVNDTIYVFGGWYEERGVKIDYPVRVEAYDPATDTWTRKKNMPVSRVHPRCWRCWRKNLYYWRFNGLGSGT